ncbi:MAG: tRNA pseudouridine(38-40) synthase TruA [Acholeplasmataceae bacterium]
MKYVAKVAYDGTDYHGFQAQPNVKTVQGMIERGFRLMTQTDIKIHASGRTDSGVHAKGQVFHFDSNLDLTEETWVKGVNRRLPLDIRIISIKKAKKGFHARHSAKAKTYEYIIAKQPSTPFSQRHEVYIENFKIEPVKNAVSLLQGTHDFRGFCKYVKDKPTVKTIYSVKIKETKKHYKIIFHGNSFLKYMVRSIVGTLIDIGKGLKNETIITKILTTQDRLLASKTAEARGLFLVKVEY